MGKETNISWCDSTVNGQMGCDGCELWSKSEQTCYAGRLTAVYGGRKGWPISFDQPALFPERIVNAAKWGDLTGRQRPSKPWLGGLPRVIFLNDMGDTFTESLPYDWLAPYMGAMMASPHIWQILTKRPQRAVKFFKELGYVPANFWIGVSVTSPANANRIKYLADLPGDPVRFVSYEPALAAVDFRPFLADGLIDWLIGGGESGPGCRYSDPAWFRAAAQACKAAAVPYYHKQNGGEAKIGGEWGGDLLDGEKYKAMPYVKAMTMLTVGAGQ